MAGAAKSKAIKMQSRRQPREGMEGGGSIIITVVVGFVGAVVVTLMRLPAPMICIFLLKCRRAY